MKIFIAGGTGAIGRVLVPLLVNAGKKVVALTRSAGRASQLEQMGALAVVGDVYDELRLARSIAESEAVRRVERKGKARVQVATGFPFVASGVRGALFESASLAAAAWCHLTDGKRCAHW